MQALKEEVRQLRGVFAALQLLCMRIFEQHLNAKQPLSGVNEVVSQAPPAYMPDAPNPAASLSGCEGSGSSSWPADQTADKLVDHEAVVSPFTCCDQGPQTTSGASSSSGTQRRADSEAVLRHAPVAVLHNDLHSIAAVSDATGKHVVIAKDARTQYSHQPDSALASHYTELNSQDPADFQCDARLPMSQGSGQASQSGAVNTSSPSQPEVQHRGMLVLTLLSETEIAQVSLASHLQSHGAPTSAAELVLEILIRHVEPTKLRDLRGITLQHLGKETDLVRRVAHSHNIDLSRSFPGLTF